MRILLILIVMLCSTSTFAREHRISTSVSGEVVVAIVYRANFDAQGNVVRKRKLAEYRANFSGDVILSVNYRNISVGDENNEAGRYRCIGKMYVENVLYAWPVNGSPDNADKIYESTTPIADVDEELNVNDRDHDPRDPPCRRARHSSSGDNILAQAEQWTKDQIRAEYTAIANYIWRHHSKAGQQGRRKANLVEFHHTGFQVHLERLQ